MGLAAVQVAERGVGPEAGPGLAVDLARAAEVGPARALVDRAAAPEVRVAAAMVAEVVLAEAAAVLAQVAVVVPEQKELPAGGLPRPR